MPAVSTNTIGPSSVSTSVSIESRVVPAMSWTTERSSPTSRLNSVDLPTFGRPTMATRGGGGSSAVHGCSVELDVDIGRAVVRLRLGCGREPGHHLVEQVTGAPSVQRAHRERLSEAEGEELPAVVLPAVVVRLVDDDDHLLAAAPQPRGDRLVVVGHPDGAVDDEQHHVGVADGGLDLPADLGLELRSAGHPAAGVDDAEGDAEPIGLQRLAVARHARVVLDDRRLLADDAVEQRALPDVRATDDGDDGEPIDAGHWCTISSCDVVAPSHRAGHQ